MIRTLASLAVSLAALPALAACAKMDQPDHSAADIPAAHAVGEAVSCINTRLIRNSRVYSDDTIDFEMNGKTRYRNVLPNSCPSLGFEERFAYTTSTSQLCSTDVITVLPSGGGVPGATCGLGRFQPIELDKPS